MGEIINKINCPNGCQNPIFTESVRIIHENTGNLLNESFNSNGAGISTKRVKVYNCGCCGSTFEMYQNKNNNLLI